jgi:hypothetical protein
MSREAMKLALEALEDVPYMSNKDDYERLERVKTALRQALVDDVNTSQERVDETTKCKHEWVGLTDEEVSYCRYAATFCDELDTAYMAELIEKDLKEKNKW